MKQTLPHFLQMIHEQKVMAIVMLTKLDEKKGGEARLHFTGNNKRITSHFNRWNGIKMWKILAHTWKDQETGRSRDHLRLSGNKWWHCIKQIGNKETVHKNEGRNPNWMSTRSSQKLQNGFMLQDEVHTFTHYFFKAWPDFGVPDTPKSLVSLIKLIRGQEQVTENNPLLVHCSAGVGRTGTFIGLWNVMEDLDRGQNETINTFKTVMDMRRARCLMVTRRTIVSGSYIKLAI